MNRLQHISWIVISVWFMVCCTDEDAILSDYSTNPEVSRTVKLNFSAPATLDFNIARSSGIPSDYLIQDLFIYVFDAKTGKVVTLNKDNKAAPVHYDYEQLTNGTTGAQEFKTNSMGGSYNANWIRFEINNTAFDSEVYIYMIANSSLYAEILSSGGKDLGSITDKKDLDELINIYNSTNIQLDRSNFMMSGHTDATQSANEDFDATAPKFYITKDGMIIRQIKNDDGIVTATLDASITLERSEAKVEFNFKSGKNGTFTPKTFRIHNYPLKSNMICKYYLQTSFGYSGTKIANKDASHSEKEFFNTNEINIEGSSFSFYMPENLKYPGKENNGGTLLEDQASISKAPSEGFTLRGKRNKEGNWVNAPTFATYVEIKGKYTGTANKKDATADVTYFIHLGFSSAANGKYYVNDYYIRRNYKYIYTITVNGVDDIITEVNSVDAEKDVTSAEGIVTWEEDVTLTDSGYPLTCYKKESLVVLDEEASDWLQVTNSKGESILTSSPLTAKTECTVKVSTPLPEGRDSRTATLKITRENEWTNSKTIRIFHITQQRK